jgi:hypothetical protein
VWEGFKKMDRVLRTVWSDCWMKFVQMYQI